MMMKDSETKLLPTYLSMMKKSCKTSEVLRQDISLQKPLRTQSLGGSSCVKHNKENC